MHYATWPKAFLDAGGSCIIMASAYRQHTLQSRSNTNILEHICGRSSRTVLRGPSSERVPHTADGDKATEVRPATISNFPDSTTTLHAASKLHIRLMITNTQALWGKSVHAG
jgi:hypothetical protein